MLFIEAGKLCCAVRDGGVLGSGGRFAFGG